MKAAAAGSGIDHAELLAGLLAPAEQERLVALFTLEWLAYVCLWKKERRVLLDRASREILCRAACAWAGILLSEHDVHEHARELGTASGNRRARRRRSRAENWLAGIIKRIRIGDLRPPAGSAAQVLACHADVNGKLLPAATAAGLLFNLLHFMVTVADMIPLVALALHEQPRFREVIRREGPERARQFVRGMREKTGSAAARMNLQDGTLESVRQELLVTSAALLASVMDYGVSRYDFRRVLEFAGPGLVLWEVTPIAGSPDPETPQEGQLRSE